MQRDDARLPPVPDRRKGARRDEVGPFSPKIEDDRLPRRAEGEPVQDGQLAVRVAVVFGEGEVGTMALEEVDRFLKVVMQLDLELDRVGL
jgi:hypothetical protein